MNGKLIVSEGGRDRIHEICEERVLIGRGSNVDLHLRSQDVAARHCQILREAEGFRILDLETVEGTKVNGHFVNEHLLQNGDTIELGSVRLTYLGDSARARAPRREPQMLKVHPRDDDGRPRRFYRHEDENRGMRTAITLLVIFGALGLGALLIIWAGSSSYAPEGEKQFVEAKELIKDGEEAGLKKAIAIIKAIPDGAVDSRERRDALDEARSKLTERRETAAARKAEDRYVEIHNGFVEDKRTVQWLRGQVKVYLEDYPGTLRARELKELLDRATLGGDERVKEWQDLLAKLRVARRAKDYKQALDLVAQAEADAGFRKVHGADLQTQRGIIESEFRRHFERMKAAAELARSQGDLETALEIYTELAAAGIEPYAAEARSAVEALQ